LRIDDLVGLEALSSRERATRVYGLLRMFLDIPVEARTETLSRLTAVIENRPDREGIHSALREFWSHHSYVRVISEAGLPDEAFLLRELLARALDPCIRYRTRQAIDFFTLFTVSCTIRRGIRVFMQIHRGNTVLRVTVLDPAREIPGSREAHLQ
jgi:hypothetical protein